MKRILLIALLTLSSTAFATPPTGKVRISIIRSEIVLVNKEYKWITTLLCQETLPFEVQDLRGSTAGTAGQSTACRFTEGGVRYHAFANYMAAYSTYEMPGEPSYPTLGFMGDVSILDENYGLPPFAVPSMQSFFTKDLNLKNALMTLLPNQGVMCSSPMPTPAPFLSQVPTQENCSVVNPLGIQAVFEYDIQ